MRLRPSASRNTTVGGARTRRLPQRGQWNRRGRSARVAPADLVETTQTDPPHQESEQPPVRREWGRSCSRESGSQTGRGRPSHRTDPGNHRQVCDAVRVRRERAFLLPEATRLPVHFTPRGPSSPAMNRAIPRRHDRPVSGTHIGPSGRAAARHDGQSAQTVGSASRVVIV